MSIILRPYQQDAVGAVYHHLRTRKDNPCVVIPTAGGKTPVMAQIVRDAVTRWGGRVLILAHVKELLEQALDNLNRMAPDLTLKIGAYSASLKSRDTDHPVIVGQIQSVYQRACEMGPFDLILIDEAHMLPPDGEGRYRTFLADAMKVNPKVRLIGLTATPYRMSTGMICAEDHLLNHVCYEVGVRELIRDGFICPLKSKAGAVHASASGLHVRGGEFVSSETDALMNDVHLVRSACAEIVKYSAGRRACLIFAQNLSHAELIRRTLQANHQVDVEVVDGDTPDAQREDTLARFKAGRLKYLVNVNVLTTGFDATICDLVALMRLTNSPGLYYQMVGRGFRLHPGKADCLVLDFGDNVVRHGPVDDIRVKTPGEGTTGDAEPPGKECPECHSLVHAGFAKCPDCGHAFPKPELKHSETASDAGVLSGEVTQVDYDVKGTTYALHEKTDTDGEVISRTLRVDYRWGFWSGMHTSEWICFEHTGWARHKAESWWRERSHAPAPATIEDALALIGLGQVAETFQITVRQVAGERFDRIVGYKLGDKPEPTNLLAEEDMAPVGANLRGGFGEDDIPF